MNGDDAVARLRAWHRGRPVPRGETLPFRVAPDDDILVLAFVRMGGESRPWGVAIGHPGRRPRIHTVPEARNRDLVAGMMSAVAPTLLRHLRVPGFVRRTPESAEDLAPIRQVWVPNATHLEMLHHLAFAYTFTRWGGEQRAQLNALGRACGWLFREAQRTGQQHVLVATAVLRDAYTFPAEDARQGHLGFLLAWAETRGGRDRRLAAALDAEQRSMATALDPGVERDGLQPLVEEWGAADRADDAQSTARIERRIRAVLDNELRHRFELTCRAIERIRKDSRRENRGVDTLVDLSLKEQWWSHARTERGLAGIDPDAPTYVPPVETDRDPRAAASRYFVHVASADMVESVLVHDDRERLAAAVADGRALVGRVTGVRDEGDGRRTQPVWVVEQRFDTPMRLRAGQTVCQVGLPRRKATIRSLEPRSAGWRAELEITNLKLAPNGERGRLAWAPTDRRWRGETVTFSAAPADGISRRKSRNVWDASGPGAWLTHARPGGAHARPTPDDRDDVPQASVLAATADRPEEIA